MPGSPRSAADLPDLGVIERGVIAARDGRIAFAGSRSDFPSDADAAERIDCDGRWITPGLVDCHTHLVFGGNRAHEFELRLQGASYEEIARAGGGIVSTVAATRASSEAELVAGALPRLDALIGEGVTTIEIKSGYGLDTRNRDAAAVGRARAGPRPAGRHPDDVSRRACAAAGSRWRQGSIHRSRLPRDAAGGGAGRARRRRRCLHGRHRVLAASKPRACSVRRKALGLPVKLHADQLSNLGGAALAAEFSALSADHLEHTDEAGVAAMARAGTVAVLLPGAFYFIRETQKPPVELFRAHGVNMALATDCNPGSSPLTSLLLAMNMGATLFRMTVAECLAGVTREGARALGILGETGTLEAGKYCDLAIWDIERPAELIYRMGFNPLHRRVWRGQ